MSKLRWNFLRFLSLCLIIGFLVTPTLLCSAGAEIVGGVEAEGGPAEVEPVDLEPRAVPTKPAHTVIGPGVYPNLVVVKFVEGGIVRLRQGKLVNMGIGNITAVSDLLQQFPGVKVERLFTKPEEDLEAERVRGQALLGKELADLNNYYLFTLPEGLDASLFIDALNAMDMVEIAYPEPIAEPAVVESPPVPGDIPPPTPDFTGGQGYLDAAPTGVDADYASTLPGGSGAGVEVVDIEGGWQIGHEDLDIDDSDLLSGTNSTDPGWRNHGTAVLGEIIGYNNNYGVTGIASESEAHMVSIFDNGTANAINIAASNLNPGDIILIELHALGPDSGLVCECNCSQFEYIAMEYWQGNFDAIQSATANGIIVVGAAGNGSMNLNSTIYGGNFDRSVRDSGAIMVAAATSSVPHNPHCWTNYGNRIDSYGWGDTVRTTGYGDLFDGGGDQNQYYTNYFSGTSSASPIVVGAAASLQGHVKALTGGYLRPLAMREILTGTGTTQGFEGSWGYKHVTTLPDLKKATSFLKGKIDLDTLEAPSLFAETKALKKELKKLGVLFRGNGKKNGGAVLNEGGISGVTGHSSPNFLAFDCGARLSDGRKPKLPETITFKKPYPTNVTLKIGSDSSAGEVVKIKAKNPKKKVLDSASVTLAPGLQNVTLSGRKIKQVRISGKDACVAVVDDIYFGGCMTGEYIDNFGSIYYLTEDGSGNVSGKIKDVGWVLSGSRSGSDVTFKATNPALEDGWCFSFTFTGTVDGSCDTATGTWAHVGGICGGGGLMTLRRTGIPPTEPPVLPEGPNPISGGK